MQIQVGIGFYNLIRMVKKTSKGSLYQTKKELDKVGSKEDKISDLESFLLQAPIFSEQQFGTIASSRKAINEWRKN